MSTLNQPFLKSAQNLDWQRLGVALRACALDAHEGELPPVDIAYSFLLENPECFGQNEWPYDWPTDMPQEAPTELLASYLVGAEIA